MKNIAENYHATVETKLPRASEKQQPNSLDR